MYEVSRRGRDEALWDVDLCSTRLENDNNSAPRPITGPRRGSVTNIGGPSWAKCDPHLTA